jgi:hypothetical protein
MVRVAEDTQLYQVIHIDGMKLTYEARTAIGEVYDAFTLEKVLGEPNRLVEGSVGMQERRRSSVPAVAPTLQATPVPAPAK